MIPRAKIVKFLREVPPGEHVEEPNPCPGSALKKLDQRLGVDARRRNVVPQAIHRQHPQSEQHPPPEVRDLPDVLETLRSSACPYLLEGGPSDLGTLLLPRRVLERPPALLILAALHLGPRLDLSFAARLSCEPHWLGQPPSARLESGAGVRPPAARFLDDRPWPQASNAGARSWRQVDLLTTILLANLVLEAALRQVADGAASARPRSPPCML